MDKNAGDYDRPEYAERAPLMPQFPRGAVSFIAVRHCWSAWRYRTDPGICIITNYDIEIIKKYVLLVIYLDTSARARDALGWRPRQTSGGTRSGRIGGCPRLRFDRLPIQCGGAGKFSLHFERFHVKPQVL
jgi:hypothetical protein